MRYIMILALVILLAGCGQEIRNDVRSEIISPVYAEMQLSTDKELYHSNELMNINVEIGCERDIENAGIKVYGIYASRNRLDISSTANITEGENNLQFGFMTPPCNTCSGITAGSYEITAELSDGGKVIATATKKIEVKQ